MPEIGTVRAAMLAAGDRARGIVVVHRPGSDLGHAFNVVRHTIGGRPAVSFLDGQTGTVARLPRDAALHFLPLTPDITPDDRAVPVPADALGQVGILDPAAPADPPTAPSADPAESAGQPAPSATA
ncbi:toxin glutamine deamidase domain-containing protein [Micromonospora krabiensis]|uniref:toxin glutamine deamidase domain-containing protein n=1 Tax=Micromonospora krabiensis TaxID=307121 RepID=UPI002F916BA1